MSDPDELRALAEKMLGYAAEWEDDPSLSDEEQVERDALTCAQVAIDHYAPIVARLEAEAAEMYEGGFADGQATKALCHCGGGYLSGATPRWADDLIVQANGWVEGRCPDCGHPTELIDVADRLARLEAIEAAARALEDYRSPNYDHEVATGHAVVNKILFDRLRAALEGGTDA